jgi:hypothetical protein
VAQAPHRHIQRASRELLAVARAEAKSHEILRNRLLAIAWVTIALVILATPVVYLIEHGANGTQIDTLWEAFLFTLSQLVTASSVTSPVTQAGKVLELVFDVYAITVVATLAGSLGAFFLHRREEHEQAAKAEADAADAASAASAASAS